MLLVGKKDLWTWQLGLLVISEARSRKISGPRPVWAAQLEPIFPNQIYDNGGRERMEEEEGGEEREREREQLILDREQLRKPLSLPSSHLPSSRSGSSLPWNTVSPPAGTWTLPQTT